MSPELDPAPMRSAEPVTLRAMSPLDVPVWIVAPVRPVPLIEPESVAASSAPPTEESVMSPDVVRTLRSELTSLIVTLPPDVCTSTLPPIPAICTFPPPPTTLTTTVLGTDTRYCTSQMIEGPTQSALMTSEAPSTCTLMSGLNKTHLARRLTCT